MKGAVMYLQLSAPALWFYVMAECLKRYLLAQVHALHEMPCRHGTSHISIAIAHTAAPSPDRPESYVAHGVPHSYVSHIPRTVYEAD